MFFGLFGHKDKPVQTIAVLVHSRSGMLFDGKVRSFSASNQIGNFDILPMHSHYVGTFDGQVDLVLENGQHRKLDLSAGVIRFKEGTVEVFEGI